MTQNPAQSASNSEIQIIEVEGLEASASSTFADNNAEQVKLTAAQLIN